MNILIVGNGFDLSHYLPTKYDHFMVAMGAIENWDVSKGDMNFDDLFGSLYETEGNFFKYTKGIYAIDEVYLKEEEINEFKIILDKNIWYRYFKYYRTKTETWIDLEKKIEEGLECCSSFFELVNSKISEYSKISYTYGELGEQKSNKEIKLHSRDIHILNLLKILSIKKLISPEPLVQWEEIEFSKGSYTLKENDRKIINNDFMSDNGQYRLYDFNKAINFLYRELDIFISVFNKYLIYLVNNVECKIEKFENILKPDYVYSFNYSNTIERLYGNEVKYLHGKAESNSSKLVLGISDLNSSFLKKIKAYGFTKYHQKLLINTDYHFLSKNLKLQQINDFWKQADQGKRAVTGFDKNKFVANIFIWGHSLDVSDKSYINEIFSFNKNYDSNVRVTIFFFNDQAKFDLLANLIHVLGADKVEIWMKNNWLKFEKNPNIVEINNIQSTNLQNTQVV